MKIVKEIHSPDGKYKSIISLRDDGLYDVDCQYWSVGGDWNSIGSSSHIADTLDNAMKLGEEQLSTLSGRELNGMTVNERLVVKGLHREFDEAINAKDKQRAIAILIKVRLTNEQAIQTVEAIFKNPKMYGYK